MGRVQFFTGWGYAACVLATLVLGGLGSVAWHGRTTGIHTSDNGRTLTCDPGIEIFQAPSARAFLRTHDARRAPLNAVICTLAAVQDGSAADAMLSLHFVKRNIIFWHRNGAEIIFYFENNAKNLQ